MRWQVAGPTQLYCLSRIHLYHVSAHSPTCLVDNLHSRQQVALVLAVRVSWQMTTARISRINIPEYTEHFRVYMDLRNQGATSTGQMIHTYNYSPHMGCCHDQCDACLGLPQLASWPALRRDAKSMAKCKGCLLLKAYVVQVHSNL